MVYVKPIREPEGLLIPVEYKYDSFGIYQGRCVAVDYG